MYRKHLAHLFFTVMGLIFVTNAYGSDISDPGDEETYIILYRRHAVPYDAAGVVSQAAGELTAGYDQIGVVIARSDQKRFGETMLKHKEVEAVVSTENYGIPLTADEYFPQPGDLAKVGQLGFSSLQWDMNQIQVPEAHAITTGDPSVVVGIIDTGIDHSHPDLRPNIDFERSVSCLGGFPNQDPAAWGNGHWHGTHVAGTVAAVADGKGITGVAPGVSLAAIQAGNAQGYFFPEAVICAFVWAGDHQFEVTNSSYYVDPWLYNCRNDANQRAIWKALKRAVNYALQRGVIVVTASGNENDDLAHSTTDTKSPNYPPGSAENREVKNNCVVLPAELPGVITVSANGIDQDKASYSNYGIGVIDVTAPGGDYLFQGGISGVVLSTMPGNRYGYAQGTSMASPHVAGAAALVISHLGKQTSSRIKAIINQTADPVPCPENPFQPGGNDNFTAICRGGTGNNSFYGHGQVNVFRALTRSTANGLEG